MTKPTETHAPCGADEATDIHPICRVAVLNRGEAAVRFIRALREYNLEHKTKMQAIAVYTDPDATSPFVRMADDGVSLGAPMQPGADGSPVSAYVRKEPVLKALIDARCDAVWPGWGFVSEDADFVEGIEAAGITFIGPPSTAMRALGDKIASKSLAEAAGVPLAPWYPVADGDPEAKLVAEADRIGYPLLVKASAGGGGRGIRRVEGPDALAETVEAVKVEAAKAFGDGGVFLERCIEGARHVEVQLLVNAAGVASALGVRDCSIQRRHQKVIEETPSPVLPAATSKMLCDAACRLAENAGYRGAGTAEFLYHQGQDKAFFLEVNSRLQVEHPITEAVTGCDLVHAQIDVARNVPWSPPTVMPGGHSIEVRLNAEDPEAGFAPRPGFLEVFRPPSGPGVRVDSGVTEDMSIAPEFDSMIAKIIVHGKSRAQALARLERAMDELQVIVRDGATNKAFISTVLKQEPFLTGQADTRWLDRAMETGELGEPHGGFEAAVFAAIAQYTRERHGQIHAFFSQAQQGIPRQIPQPAPLSIDLRLRGKSLSLEVHSLGDHHYLVGQGRALHRVKAESTGKSSALLQFIGLGGPTKPARHAVMYAYGKTGIGVEIDGSMHHVEFSSGGTITTPAPAMVVHVAVEEGETVKAGDLLVTLEAMKLEMPVHASEDGIVRTVVCSANQQVAAGQTLLVMEQTGDGATSAVMPFRAPPLTGLDGLAKMKDLALAAIDKLPEDTASQYIQQLGWTVRSAILGYDTGEMFADILGDLVGGGVDLTGLTNPERLAPIATLLTVFADLATLFDRSMVRPSSDETDAAMRPSTYEEFFAFCRDHHEGDDGVGETLREPLLRALRWYGVKQLEPTEELREALWRMVVGQTHSKHRYKLGSLLLRIVIRLHEAGVRFAGHPTLQQDLERLALVADARYRTMADNARQASYTLFRQPRYLKHRRQVVEDFTQGAALLQRGEGDAGIVERLATAPESMLGLLLGTLTPSETESGPLLGITLRRIYQTSSCELHSMGASEGALATLATMSRKEGSRTIGCVVATRPEALAGVDASRLKGASALDVLLCDDASGADVTTAEVAGCLAETGAECLTLTWREGESIRHRTWRATSQGPEEDTLVTNIHPAFAERFELGRLSGFELTRLETPEGIGAFVGQASENPRDTRIFVYAGVRAVRHGGLRRDAFWEVERAFYESVRVMREAQLDNGLARKSHWNRITLYVRDSIRMSHANLARIGARLEAAAQDLGLEKVVIRGLWANPDGEGPPRETAFVFTEGADGGVTLRVHKPTDRPVRALSNYKLAVVRCRRLGLTYPYELVRTLESRQDTPGRFVEHDLNESGDELVPVSRPAGENQAAVVVGLMTNTTAKHPEGMTRVLIAADPTRSMGALAEPECRRVCAALKLASEKSLPVEWITVSAGAKIAMDSGTENLDWTAQVLRRIVEFTQAGGAIHVVVAGVNVGAQSYWNAEATMLMHTKGLLIMMTNGSMVLTGKKALEISGGVAAEDERGIGGFERIMGPNGQAHVLADSLEDAYTVLFDHYRYAYRVPGESWPRRATTADPIARDVTAAPYQSAYGEGFATVGEIFDPETNPGRKRPFAIRQVMAAVVDQDGGWMERFAAMRHAETAVTWDAHLGGIPVALIGIESRPISRRGPTPMDGPNVWTGGTLFPKSSKKVARALNAASGNRPAVILANLSGFDGSPESLRQLQLEYGAEIGRAVVNFDGPLVFVVIGRYHGGAYVVFSKELNPRLTSMALVGTYASVIGGAPAAAVVFPRDVRRKVGRHADVLAAQAALSSAAPIDKPRLREKLDAQIEATTLDVRAAVAREFDSIHTVDRAVQVGSLDRVIEPAALRPAIIEQLSQDLS